MTRGLATRGVSGAVRRIIDACPSPEIVSDRGVGHDAIDFDACRSRHIRVTSTPDVPTNDLADFGIAMMPAHARPVIPDESRARSGEWAKNGMMRLSRRVGIPGLGRTRVEVARRLAAFDMTISRSGNRPKDPAKGWHFLPDPVELALRTDFLVASRAACAATRHIAGREVIEAVGPQDMMIKISRVANIDEDAPIEALA